MIHINKRWLFAICTTALIAISGNVKAEEDRGNGYRGDEGKLTPDIIATVEHASDRSSFSGSSTEDFSRLSSGVKNNVNWDGIGTVSKVKIGNDGFAEFSGRDGGVSQTTISLSDKSSYFGFDLKGGANNGQVDFYNGSTRVGSLSLAALGGDGGFVNFTGDANTSWDKIVFSNGEDQTVGAKNWTTRVEGWNPNVDGSMPGTPTLEIKNNSVTAITKVSASFVTAPPGAPAPPVTACLAFAGVLLLQAFRNRTGTTNLNAILR